MNIQVDYAIRLTTLTGDEFQSEIETLLLQRIRHFQTVPRNPGDGGLDGLSDDGTVAYCCYGLNLTKGNPPNEKLVDAIQSKFTDDLKKLFELTLVPPPGKKRATVLTHLENGMAKGILNGRKLKHVYLCTNWFEDPKIMGYLRGKIDEMKSKSQLALVEADLTFTILGPKEIAKTFDAGADGVKRLTYPKLDGIFKSAHSLALDQTSLTKREVIDDKYEYLKTLENAKIALVEKSHLQMKESWLRGIRFLQELQNTYSDLHLAVEEIRARIAQLIETELMSGPPAQPGALVVKYTNQLRNDLRTTLASKFTNEQIDPLAEYMIAGLIGICKLDWRPVA